MANNNNNDINMANNYGVKKTFTIRYIFLSLGSLFLSGVCLLIWSDKTVGFGLRVTVFFRLFVESVNLSDAQFMSALSHVNLKEYVAAVSTNDTFK